MSIQFPRRQVFAMSSSSMVTTTALIIATVVVFLSAIFASIAIVIKQSAFADGLTQEQLSASLGNRKATCLSR